MNFQYLKLFFVVLGYVNQCRGRVSGGPLRRKLVTTTVPDTRDPELLPFSDDEADNSNVCCECVPFHLCSDDYTIITDGIGILEPRFGGMNSAQSLETCPDATVLCCFPPNAMVGCHIDKTTPPITQVTPNPNTLPCECIEWEMCPDKLRISDGSSPTTFIDGTTPLKRHSKCPHSFEVCCAFDYIPPVTPPTPPAPSASGDCFCVNPWLCGDDGFIITDGIEGIDLRALAPDDPICEPPMVCCWEPVDGATPPTKLPPPRVPTTPVPTIEDQRCSGIRNRKGISVRIGGFIQGESQFGEFPWAGMVLRTYMVADTPLNAFIGGATLINPRVMITAAHKVAKESVASLTVRVGEWDIETTYEPGAHQTRSVNSVVIHPNYNSRTLHHDVALLILTEPVVLQPHIRSICIATSVDEVDHSACVTNGWGEDSFDTGNYQTVMKSVTLPLVPSQRCQALLRKTRLGRWFQLDPSFICAGGEAGKDACSSDGGGPLACPRRGSTTEYLLVGITAWGIGCGEEGVPGVYASTMADNRWIIAEVEGMYSRHFDLRGAIIERVGGRHRVRGVNLGDQSQLNESRYASARCRPDAQDCSLAASAQLPLVTQPTTTTPGTTLSTIASTVQETPTTERSGRWRRPHLEQQHQRRERQRRRKTERQERRNRMRNRRVEQPTGATTSAATEGDAEQVGEAGWE